MTGAGTSAALGYPYFGLVTMSEMAANAGNLARAVDIPVIADADDGYGNALSTMRTVQEMIKTGVAGIHLEDQRFPKRCGHIAGKTLVTREEALGKYRAAIDVRNRLDPEFFMIARTDAYGDVGGSMQVAIDGDLGASRGLVKAASSQRRKTMGNALKPIGGARDALVRAGIDPQRRGETLSVQEFAAVERSITSASAG